MKMQQGQSRSSVWHWVLTGPPKDGKIAEASAATSMVWAPRSTVTEPFKL